MGKNCLGLCLPRGYYSGMVNFPLLVAGFAAGVATGAFAFPLVIIAAARLGHRPSGTGLRVVRVLLASLLLTPRTGMPRTADSQI